MAFSKTAELATLLIFFTIAACNPFRKALLKYRQLPQIPIVLNEYRPQADITFSTVNSGVPVLDNHCDPGQLPYLSENSLQHNLQTSNLQLPSTPSPSPVLSHTSQSSTSLTSPTFSHYSEQLFVPPQPINPLPSVYGIYSQYESIPPSVPHPFSPLTLSREPVQEALTVPVAPVLGALSPPLIQNGVLPKPTLIPDRTNLVQSNKIEDCFEETPVITQQINKSKTDVVFEPSYSFPVPPLPPPILPVPKLTLNEIPQKQFFDKKFLIPELSSPPKFIPSTVSSPLSVPLPPPVTTFPLPQQLPTFSKQDVVLQEVFFLPPSPLTASLGNSVPLQSSVGEDDCKTSISPVGIPIGTQFIPQGVPLGHS